MNSKNKKGVEPNPMANRDNLSPRKTKEGGFVKSIAWWLLNNVKLGSLAPWVLGLALGRMPRKVK